MARRKTAVDQARAKGPVLLLDAGNALFKAPGLKSKADRARASFILKTLGQLGTQAMAAGARDLNLGAAWLKAEAKKAKVPVLSANLKGKDGARVFPASLVLEVGGHQVGVIGVSPGGGAAEAVAKEARALRPKVDAVVVLAALPYRESLTLATEVGSLVDFVLQSHEGRGPGTAQRAEGNFVLPTGERGRQLGSLTLDLAGKGPFLDREELSRDQKTLEILDTQLTQVKKRVEMTSDKATKQALLETQRQFEVRRKEVAARIEAGRKASGRGMSLSWVNLGREFKDDPAVLEGVKRIEPHGASH